MAYKRPRKDFEADLQKQESPFALYGTPLPPLDDHSRDDGSYVPVWKQEVTDDRGRKRLHGAFTGGFSAGYFNTVGSKEGWTPSTFVSSRANRAKDGRNQAQQRPEDFMDDEDIREQEESRHISTSGDFTGFGTADDANFKNALMDLFRPVEDTMGIKLLNKMGWKQGRGMGPKVRRKVDSGDNSSETHMLAPEDTPLLSVVKKTDCKGLGLVAQSSRLSTSKDGSHHQSDGILSRSDEEDQSRPGLSFASHARKATKPTRAAFGVGIMNDTGSDEEDPYSMGPKISYNRTLGGDKKTKKIKAAPSRNANPMLKNTPVFVPKKLGTISNALRKCHDGRLPLDGFVLADELDNFSTMSLVDDKYKPPAVPEGWTPAKASSNLSPDAGSYQSTAEAAKSSNHTSTSRGSLLGEIALPGKSVFDYLTPAAREKLIKVSGKNNLPPAMGEALPGAPSVLQPGADLRIPALDPQLALQALSRLLNGGFTPYSTDPAKASRYKTYLEFQANINSVSDQDPIKMMKPPNTTQEDYLTELHEFSRAAEVFKPVSGLIASRFTTATASSTSHTAPGSTDDGGGHSSTPLDLLTRPASRPRDPAEEAASIGMFGPLTRSVSTFYPTRLLCKRFGVATPSHAEPPESTTATTAGTSRFQSAGFQHRDDGGPEPQQQQLAIEAPARDVRMSEESPVPTTAPVSVTEPAAVTVDPDRNEALEQERPGAAVFRAIFGSDDEEED